MHSKNTIEIQRCFWDILHERRLERKKRKTNWFSIYLIWLLLFRKKKACKKGSIMRNDEKRVYMHLLTYQKSAVLEDSPDANQVMWFWYKIISS